MISKNDSTQTQAEADHPENGLEWYCEESDEREPELGKIPTKSCKQRLRFSLLFPNCVNLEGIAQYAFSDSTTNSCPEGMKRMPQLRISRYDTKSVAPDGWDGNAPFQLSYSDTPGEGYCFHGDLSMAGLRMRPKTCSSVVAVAATMAALSRAPTALPPLQPTAHLPITTRKMGLATIGLVSR